MRDKIVRDERLKLDKLDEAREVEREVENRLKMGRVTVEDGEVEGRVEVDEVDDEAEVPLKETRGREVEDEIVGQDHKVRGEIIERATRRG